MAEGKIQVSFDKVEINSESLEGTITKLVTAIESMGKVTTGGGTVSNKEVKEQGLNKVLEERNANKALTVQQVTEARASEKERIESSKQATSNTIKTNQELLQNNKFNNDKILLETKTSNSKELQTIKENSKYQQLQMTEQLKNQRNDANLSYKNQELSVKENMQKVGNAFKMDYLKESLAGKKDLETHKADLETEKFQKRLELKNANKAQQQAKDDERSYGKVLKGIAIGSVTAMAYQAGGLGKVAGSEAGALNANPSNYMDFMSGMMNKQADARQSLYNSASMGVGALAGALAGAGVGASLGSIIPGFGTAIGGAVGLGVGALGSYYTNKSTEKEKATNQFAMSQELDAWRLQAQGLSGRSDKIIKGSGHLFGEDRQDVSMSELQKVGLSVSPFNVDIAQTAQQGRRDVMSGMSPQEIADYNPKLTKQALMTGEDKSQLGMVVSAFAGISGTKVTDALDKLNKTQEKYGGEANKIGSAALEIMKSNKNISGDKALELAGSYQQNQGMLNQTLSQQQMAFSSRVQAKQLMQLLPDATSEELRTGILNEKHQNQYTKEAQKGNLSDTPMGMIKERILGLSGTNPFLNPNKIKAGGGKALGLDDAGEPATMTSYGQMIDKALQGITTSSMSVNAGVVNINGKVDAGAPLASKISEKSMSKIVQQPDSGYADDMSGASRSAILADNAQLRTALYKLSSSGTYKKPR